MRKTMIAIGMMMTIVLMLTACSKVIEEESTPMASGTMTEEVIEDMAEKETMENMAEETIEDMTEKETKEDMTEDKVMDDMGMDEDVSHDGMEKMTNEGSMAPNFALTSLEDETIDLEDLRGEKVYIKFWASWCPICLGGMPELDELAGSDEDFRVLTIVSPGHSGEKSTEAFKEWYMDNGGENITVLIDESGELLREYGVRGYPTSAYIGSDGVLVKTQPGHQDNEAIRDSFEKIY